MTEPPVVKSAIDLKDITIKASSAIALYWVIDRTLTSDENYMEYLRVGLVGAAGLTVIAPLLDNMLNGKDIMNGINFNMNMVKQMLIDGGISAVIYFALKTIFADQINDSLLYKYVAVIASVIGADMFMPSLMKQFSA